MSLVDWGQSISSEKIKQPQTGYNSPPTGSQCCFPSHNNFGVNPSLRVRGCNPVFPQSVVDEFIEFGFDRIAIKRVSSKDQLKVSALTIVLSSQVDPSLCIIEFVERIR